MLDDYDDGGGGGGDDDDDDGGEPICQSKRLLSCR
jgi:hypothetical protein